MKHGYQGEELADVMEAVETTDLMDLIVFNDDVNSFDHVITTLIRVCQHTPEQAEQCTLLIHYKGKCPVKSGTFDFLKPMRESICEAGIDARILWRLVKQCGAVDYPSKLIENAVNQIAKLPGIGKKTALRLALHLIRDKAENTTALTEALTHLRERIKFCATCHNISDHDVCDICLSHKRDRGVLCVVEDAKDVMAIENTAQYTGLYHVLGGVISPMNGIGPSDLRIESLVTRLNHGQSEIKEVILALSPTMEGDTTAFYINRRIQDLHLKVSVIARGIPVGGDLEYADEITLGRSILGRTLFS